MTESITQSTLFNSFAVFREILQGISALTTLNSKWSEDGRYYEDAPLPKSRNFSGYPLMMIETESEQESLTIKNKKQMMYTTTVSIYTDYYVEKEGGLLNSYMGVIVDWFNKNKNTLRWTYGLFGLSDIETDRETEEIAEKLMVKGTLVFNYHVTMDMSL